MAQRRLQAIGQRRRLRARGLQLAEHGAERGHHVELASILHQLGQHRRSQQAELDRTLVVEHHVVERGQPLAQVVLQRGEAVCVQPHVAPARPHRSQQLGQRYTRAVELDPALGAEPVAPPVHLHLQRRGRDVVDADLARRPLDLGQLGHAAQLAQHLERVPVVGKIPAPGAVGSGLVEAEHPHQVRRTLAFGAERAQGVQVTPVACVQHLGRAFAGVKDRTTLDGPYRHVQPHPGLG